MRWLPALVVLLVVGLVAAFGVHDYQTGQSIKAPLIMGAFVLLILVGIWKSGGRPGTFT